MPVRVFGERTPVCPECGAYLAKPKRHRRWHKKVAEMLVTTRQAKKQES